MGIGFGGFAGGGDGGGQTASSDYVCKTGVDVGSAEDSVEFGFSASTVAVYGTNQSIEIAFDEDGGDRFIPVAPQHIPFSIGIESDTLYHRLAGDSSPTQLAVIALK